MTETAKVLKEHGLENPEDLAQAFEEVVERIWEATYSLLKVIEGMREEELKKEFDKDMKKLRCNQIGNTLLSPK